jgi:hypothetical protein
MCSTALRFSSVRVAGVHAIVVYVLLQSGSGNHAACVFYRLTAQHAMIRRDGEADV